MKKSYKIIGLDCPNCAAKIEKKLNELDGASAKLDFMQATLKVSGADEEAIHETVHGIEEGVSLIPQHKTTHKCKECAPLPAPEENSAENKKSGGKFELIRGEITDIIRIGAAAILTAVGFILGTNEKISFFLFLAAFILSGADIVFSAIRNLFKGKLLDENFLMSIATIGAFAIGEAPEAAFVMIFYQVGELFQRIAVKRSRNSISSLMDLRPDFARVIRGGEAIEISPENVKIGEIIEVNPGERIPLDGVVREGTSFINTAALTGESVPRSVSAGDEVMSGCINKDGVLRIEVTAEYAESTVSKILGLVQNASAAKSPTEQFITRFARWYTPIVTGCAAAMAILCPLILAQPFDKWIYRALLFLLISCPCALVLSIPLGFFGGIGCAAKNGILVKGGNYLEALSKTEIAVFDKTGTLTEGKFAVTDILPADGVSENELLQSLLNAEQHSSHPLAQSLTEYCKNAGMTAADVSETEELAGLGVQCRSGDSLITAGSRMLMKKSGIDIAGKSEATAIYAAKDGKFLGCVLFADEPKKDSAAAIKALRKLGVKKIVMLTGDSESAAKNSAKLLGVDECRAELLPAQKLEAVTELKKSLSKNGKLVFVGDGINDAPVLAGADIGTAMGGIGSDAAIEAADIVLMTDEPSLLPQGISLSNRIMEIMRFIIAFCLTVKFGFLLLGALGIATMWMAMFADVGVAIIAVIISLQTMRLRKKDI